MWMKTVAGSGQSQNGNIVFHHHSSLQLYLQGWVGVQTKNRDMVQRPSSDNIWLPASLKLLFLSVSAPTEVCRRPRQADTWLPSPPQESGVIWVASFPTPLGVTLPADGWGVVFFSDGGLCHMSHSALFSLTHFFCTRRVGCPDCACVWDLFYIYHPVRNKHQTLVTSLKDLGRTQTIPHSSIWILS